MVALQSEEARRLNGQQFPDDACEMNKSSYGNNMKKKVNRRGNLGRHS